MIARLRNSQGGARDGPRGAAPKICQIGPIEPAADDRHGEAVPADLVEHDRHAVNDEEPREEEHDRAEPGPLHGQPRAKRRRIARNAASARMKTSPSTPFTPPAPEGTPEAEQMEPGGDDPLHDPGV